MSMTYNDGIYRPGVQWIPKATQELWPLQKGFQRGCSRKYSWGIYEEVKGYVLYKRIYMNVDYGICARIARVNIGESKCAVRP